MAYLISYDYLRVIQLGNLQQLITQNPSILTGVELSAQAEAISYLRQKYETEQEFTNTKLWVKAAVYNAADRVYLDADGYLSANSYVIGNLTTWNGKVYICTTNTTGVFDPADWSVIGNQGDIFYAPYPHPFFDIYNLYKEGDQVYWNGRIYTARRDSLASVDSIQYRIYKNIPLPNVFPDDVNSGSTYWQDNGAYSVPLNTNITNTTYWTKGDNRDQQMVLYFIDLALYHLHSRIAPNNIPQLRIDRYDSAIEWLKMCAKGEVTPNLPKIQPKEGARIRYGGNIRNINSY